MRGKIKITASLKILTGLHIGGTGTFSPIGATDSPVVCDTLTGRPIVPGSSLKGKMRWLLASKLSPSAIPSSPNNDPAAVKRLFGAGAPDIIRSRLQFSDCFLSNTKELESVGFTEVKTENGIDRITCQANPRQIERVVSGAKFSVVICYDIPESETEMEEDLNNLASAMRLLQIDYLGGHGSRGSGRVSFENIKLQPVESGISGESLDKFRAAFKEIEEYELLHI